MLLPYIIAWLVLILLFGISVLTAYLPIGIGVHPIANFLIAATQAAIIFTVFMRLHNPPRIKLVFAGAGFLWLFFFLAIGVIDYLTRRGFPNY